MRDASFNSQNPLAFYGLIGHFVVSPFAEIYEFLFKNTQKCPGNHVSPFVGYVILHHIFSIISELVST